MRLSSVLLRRNLLPNGHLFRGKDHLVKRVKPFHIRQLQEDFAVEEQNMLYLRHPYITEQQSYGHAKALNKQEQRKAAFQDQTRRMFKPDVTLFDRLLHLRKGETWE